MGVDESSNSGEEKRNTTEGRKRAMGILKRVLEGERGDQCYVEVEAEVVLQRAEDELRREGLYKRAIVR